MTFSCSVEKLAIRVGDGKIDVSVPIETILVIQLIRYVLCFELVSWNYSGRKNAFEIINRCEMDKIRDFAFEEKIEDVVYVNGRGGGIHLFLDSERDKPQCQISMCGYFTTKWGEKIFPMLYLANS